MKLKLLLSILTLLLHSSLLNAQNSVSDTLVPSPFIMYGDNYFVSGISLNQKITPASSDVKFRFGFAHKILNEPILWGFSLYLTYQQKSFWDIYKESAPFRDVNYNPGIALGRVIMNNNTLPVGIFFIEIEHESNGRDGIFSRSWNRISLNSSWNVHKNLLLDINFWIPFAIDKEMNRDILDYVGYYDIGLHYHVNKNMKINLQGNVYSIDELKGSITLGLLVNLSEKFNRYYYLQLFHGYGENLLEYNEKRTMLRLGISFPRDLLDIIGLSK